MAYLLAAGATQITVAERDGAGIIVTGKTTDTVAARWWIASQDAVRVATQARRLGGAGADVQSAIAAVARTGSIGATLTPDDVAIRRAADAMVRLDLLINKMKRDGTLRTFNATYKAKRAAALAEGRGYMSYSVALSRLKVALVPMLQTGQPIAGIFNQVFR